jgi:hypothetical protein
MILKMPHSHRKDLKSLVKSGLKSLVSGSLHNTRLFAALEFTSIELLNHAHKFPHLVLTLIKEPDLFGLLIIKKCGTDVAFFLSGLRNSRFIDR